MSASKWQTRFISKRSQWVSIIIAVLDVILHYDLLIVRYVYTHLQVKEFCRRFKAWKTITWKESTDGRPSSYLLTILVVIAFSKLPDDKKKMKKRKMNRIVPLYI